VRMAERTERRLDEKMQLEGDLLFDIICV
jgi:hypothetical protein